MTSAYPLAWPQNFPREKDYRQSKFRTGLSGAIKNVQTELARFGKDTGHEITNLQLSSNVSLVDSRPDDPGVACYFTWDNIDCCIAVDRYHWPEENLQAIALILEAERTKIRHGGLNIVRAAMRGYASLPPPTDPSRRLNEPWWKVLGFKARPSLDEAETVFRGLVKREHPDRGGDPAKFNAITDAIRQAREDLK